MQPLYIPIYIPNLLNLPKELFLLILHQIWTPTTHLTLSLTHRLFLQRIHSTDFFLSIYTFPISQYPPKIPSLQLCKLIAQHHNKLGQDRLQLLAQQGFTPSLPTITDTPNTMLIGFQIVTKLIYEDLVNEQQASHNLKDYIAVYDIITTAINNNTISKPYLAWRLLQKSQTWSLPFIQPSHQCPPQYHDQVSQVLRSPNLFSNDNAWKKLKYALNIPNIITILIPAIMKAHNFPYHHQLQQPITLVRTKCISEIIVDLIHKPTTTEDQCIQLLYLSKNLVESGQVFVERLLSSTTDPQPRTMQFFNQWYSPQQLPLLTNKEEFQNTCKQLATQYMQYQTIPRCTQLGLRLLPNIIIENSVSISELLLLKDSMPQVVVCDIISKHRLWYTRTKQEATQMRSMLVTASYQHSRECFSVLSALYATVPLPDPLNIHTELMGIPYLVHVCATNVKHHSHYLNALKDRLHTFGQNRQVVFALGELLDKNESYITKFTLIHDQLVLTCLSCNVLCRSKRKREDIARDNITWHIDMVLNALITHTDVVFPDKMRFCCEECTNTLKTKIITIRSKQGVSS